MSPAGDFALFSPFSELGFGSGEPECLCLGGSGLLGWLAVPWNPLGVGHFSLADAPIPLWQRCPVVVFGVAAALSWKASVWACSGAQAVVVDRRVVPSPGKLYHREGTVTYSGCRGSSIGLPEAVAHVRLVTVSCSSPLLAPARAGRKQCSLDTAFLLFSCLLEVTLTLLSIATLQFHTFWKAFFKNRIISLKPEFLS